MTMREDVEAGMRVERALWQSRMMELAERLRAQYPEAAKQLSRLTSELANPT